MILYIMLCGYPPFRGSNDKMVLAQVNRGFFSFTGKEWAGVSSEAKALIMKMHTKTLCADLPHGDIQRGLNTEQIQ